jgi:hypothetical protein
MHSSTQIMLRRVLNHVLMEIDIYFFSNGQQVQIGASDRIHCILRTGEGTKMKTARYQGSISWLI